MRPYNFSKILIVLVIMASIGTAAADAIEPGQKNVPLSYQITNIQDFPDHVFILHGTPNPSLDILDSSEFSFYKLSICSVYAVPQTVFDSVQMDQMDEAQIEEFLKNDTRVASSNLTMDGIFGTVNVADPLESALILLEIKSIKDNNLDIKKTKIIYYYSDGQKVEKPFQSENQIPLHTAPGPSWDFYLYFIALPIVALVTILILALRRRSH
jgi:hypothetical protein